MPTKCSLVVRSLVIIAIGMFALTLFAVASTSIANYFRRRNSELHLVLDILRWDVYYSARNMAMVALVYSPPNWPLTSERSQFDESNIRAYSYFAIMLGRSMIFCSFFDRVDEFAAQLEICTATLS